MAAIGTISYGQDVDYYTRGTGRDYTSYYTGAEHQGEPPGRWSGGGAAALGLVGTVDPKVMERLYAKGLDPRDPSGQTKWGKGPRNYKSVAEIVAERLAQEPDALPERQRQIAREAKRSARQSNCFADFTFSLSKDLTVQHTSAAYAERQARLAGRVEEATRYQHIRETIEAAGHAGNQAALNYLVQHAGYARTGRHGKGGSGRWIEAKKWTIATFFQHTSRALDPQLHWHNPILLNTECADGQVRKIHTTLLQAHKQGAAAMGARVTQEIITERLGWTFAPRTDGNGHELTNVDQKIKDLFSERAKGITENIAPLVEDFVAVHGREPNRLEMERIRQRVCLEQRPPKPKTGETREQAEARWDAKLRAELGAGLGRQAAASSGILPGSVLPEEWSPRATIARAIARCQQVQSTWGRSELTRALEAELPSYLGIGAKQVPLLLERLADEALASDMVQQVTHLHEADMPEGMVLDNGRSAYIQPGSTRYASKEHVAAEYALQRAAVARGRAAVSASVADVWLESAKAMGLQSDQEAAIRGILTSGAAVSVLVGPAGAGKTYVLGALSTVWSEATGGRVLGLATSEQATDVLRGEDVAAKNVAQWLAAQRRIEEGRPQGDDLDWVVRADDIIVPDEASMADTDKLAEIRRYVEQVGARMLLTGDPRQLSAVGPAGAMDLIVNTDEADVYELAEVRRFKAGWEGPASLRLRTGDVEVLDDYLMHDRIRDGGTAEDAMTLAARMYVGDRLRGKTSVVVTPTNAMAAEVNGMIRDQLVKAGRVAADGVLLDRDGNYAGVGDIVKCRKNLWVPGSEVKNQGRYVVQGFGEHGEMHLREEGTGREVTVSAAYRREWIELGYAGTVHSVQGGTYDTGIPIIKAGQPLESLYPAMTRGRERNTAVVVTVSEYQDPATYSVKQREPVDAAGVIADIMERENEDAKAALTLAREDAERATSLRVVMDMYEEAVRDICRTRTVLWLDRLAASGAISEDERLALAADRTTEQLGRLLRSVEQAGHDAEQVLRDTVGGRTLSGARSPAQVLYHRIMEEYKGRLTPKGEPGAPPVPPLGAPREYRAHLETLQDIIRAKRMRLGAELAKNPPEWAVEALGEVPEDLLARAEWEDRAGRVAAHREASGWTDEQEPLGPAPGMSKTESRAAWHEAWIAAGRPESTSEEHELSEGLLRVRVRSMQVVNATLPPSVYDEMQAVERELYEHQRRAAELYAEADVCEDAEEAERLREMSAEVEVLAQRLEDKRQMLQEVADERLAQRAETATTRVLGQRALDELMLRGVPVDTEPDRVTAEEWMRLHEESMLAEDPYRQVTEDDLLPEPPETVAEVAQGSRVPVEEWMRLHEESMLAEDPYRQVTEDDIPQVSDDDMRAVLLGETREAEQAEADPAEIAQDDRVPAEEWMRLHEESMLAEDPYRQVTEDDIPQVSDDDMRAVLLGETREAEQAEADQAEAAAETRLDGVPTDAEISAMVTVTKVAVERSADLASAEQARIAHERAQQAIELARSMEASDRARALAEADAAEQRQERHHGVDARF